MGIKANTLLIIGFVWPEPSTTAAGGRMLQLIDFFLTRDYEITFASTAAKREYTYDIGDLGIKMQHIRLNDSGFDGFLEKLNPNMVLFDRFLTEEQFGWRVAQFAPEAIRILDTEDLHSLRKVREKCFKTNQAFTTTSWTEIDITKREIASIFRCDLSLIVSTYEMHLLLNVVSIDNKLLLHLPFQLDKIESEHATNWPGFNARKDFICIGNGKHAPNRDAIVWLKNEIWPLIRKALPTVNLHVYGSYLPEQIRQMHDPEAGFYIEGWVENLSVTMGQHRINLAPLRFGAGIKGKLTTAMQCGTPSITTTIGAEGMHGDLPWCGCVSDTAESFANAAVGLYNEAEDWRQAQENGVIIINTFYDRKVLDKRLSDKILSLQNDLSRHRKSNFIGALLMYETMASTKYMSRWIEEKNRNQ